MTRMQRKTAVARKRLHRFFDTLWVRGDLSRAEAYEMLYRETGHRHISEMTRRECNLFHDRLARDGVRPLRRAFTEPANSPTEEEGT